MSRRPLSQYAKLVDLCPPAHKPFSPSYHLLAATHALFGSLLGTRVPFPVSSDSVALLRRYMPGRYSALRDAGLKEFANVNWYGRALNCNNRTAIFDAPAPRKGQCATPCGLRRLCPWCFAREAFICYDNVTAMLRRAAGRNLEYDLYLSVRRRVCKMRNLRQHLAGLDTGPRVPGAVGALWRTTVEPAPDDSALIRYALLTAFPRGTPCPVRGAYLVRQQPIPLAFAAGRLCQYPRRLLHDAPDVVVALLRTLSDLTVSGSVGSFRHAHNKRSFCQCKKTELCPPLGRRERDEYGRPADLLGEACLASWLSPNICDHEGIALLHSLRALGLPPRKAHTFAEEHRFPVLVSWAGVFDHVPWDRRRGGVVRAVRKHCDASFERGASVVAFTVRGAGHLCTWMDERGRRCIEPLTSVLELKTKEMEHRGREEESTQARRRRQSPEEDRRSSDRPLDRLALD